MPNVQAAIREAVYALDSLHADGIKLATNSRGQYLGDKADKSQVFNYIIGSGGTPIIKDAPIVMECNVEDNYVLNNFDNFICSIINTYADETILNEAGKIDYDKLKPVLFEMPTYSYLRTGERIGKCKTICNDK